jgi:putative endonuclease
MTKKKNWNQEIGRRGEDLAEEYFHNLGFDILARNYHTAYGEIDLVIEKDKAIIFIEVKTRTGSEYGYGEAAVDYGKLEHLTAAAEYYMATEKVDTETWQIDVLAVMINPIGAEPEYEWFENVA